MMIANLLVSRHLDPSVLTAALAAAAHVPTTHVDLRHADDDQDGRDWYAPVLCTYHHLRGDLALSLDIQVQGEQVRDVRDATVTSAGEPRLAAALAHRTGAGVLYPDDRIDPQTYWLADPSGLVTRVRLLTTEDDPPVHTVDAVEAPSLAFPHAEVTPLAEILREYPVPTPLADATGLSTPAAVSLTIWERMVRRMAADWPPSGRYLPELYAHDLAARDHFAREIATCPQHERTPLLAAAARIDALFRTLTVDTTEGTGSWWRTRVPRRTPWP